MNVDLALACQREQSIQIGSRLPLPNVPVERVGRSRVRVRIRLEDAATMSLEKV